MIIIIPGDLDSSWGASFPRNDCPACREGYALRIVGLSIHFDEGTTISPTPDPDGIEDAMKALFAATNPKDLYDPSRGDLQSYSVAWDSDALEAVIVYNGPFGVSAANANVEATEDVAGIHSESKIATKPGWQDGLAWRDIDGVNVSCGYKTFDSDGMITTYGSPAYVNATVAPGDTTAFADAWIPTGVPAQGHSAGLAGIDAYAPTHCIE